MSFTKDLITSTQTRLKELGYYNLRVDGISGPGTEEAMTRFKEVSGLRERPFPGPITLGLLWGDDAIPFTVTPPVGSTSEDPAILTEARRHLGVQEIRGSKHSPTIMGWADDLDQWYPGDETPWCGLFVAICAARGAPDEPQDFNRLGARQWLKWGKPTDGYPLGSVVVFWRTAPSHWHGHVAIVTGQNDTHVRVIGGNQSNEVNERWFAKSRVLGVRVPEGIDYPESPVARTGQLSTNEA